MIVRSALGGRDISFSRGTISNRVALPIDFSRSPSSRGKISRSREIPVGAKTGRIPDWLEAFLPTDPFGRPRQCEDSRKCTVDQSALRKAIVPCRGW